MFIFKVQKENFFKIFPMAERNVSINGEVICNLGNEVMCDYCNIDVFTEVENHGFLISHRQDPQNSNDISDVVCRTCANSILYKCETEK